MTVNKTIYTNKKSIKVTDYHNHKVHLFCGCTGINEPTVTLDTRPASPVDHADDHDAMDGYCYGPGDEEFMAPAPIPAAVPVEAQEAVPILFTPAGEPIYTEPVDIKECPLCGQAPEIVFHTSTGYGRHPIVNYAEAFDNGHLVSLSIGMAEYVFLAKLNKVFYKPQRVRYTFNSNTGFTYYITKGKIRNVTYSPLGNGEPYYLEAQTEFPEAVEAFQKMCAEKRGLEYLDWDKLKGISNSTDGFSTTHFRYVLKFPVLQNMPSYELTGMGKADRAFLAAYPSTADFFRYYTGHGAKKLRKLVGLDAELFKHLAHVGRLFTSPEHVEKIMLAIKETGSVNLYGGFSPIKRVKDNGPFGFDNVAYEISLMEEMAELTCNGDMTVFVNRLIRERRNTVVAYQENEQEVAPRGPVGMGRARNNATKAIYKDVFSLEHAISLMNDTLRIYKQIKERVPSYELKFRSSFHDLHELVSKDFNRIAYPNVFLPVAKGTEDYNRTVNGIEFRLAETTLRLTDVGSKMSLCVGGYRQHVLAGGTIIVMAYYEDKYLACLEVSPSKRVTQAKLHHNNLPTQMVHDAVKQWAEEVGCSTSCYDMTPDYVTEQELSSLLYQPEELDVILDASEYVAEESQAFMPNHYGQPQQLQAPMAQVAEPF